MAEGGGGELGDDVIRRIANFEDGIGGEAPAWLGGPKGLVVGLVLLFVAGAVLALAFVAMFALAESRLSELSKLIFGVAGVALMAVVAYWRRQRLAAHFEAAKRLVDSANGDECQRGLTEMIVNARRGRAEHRRIAAALTAFLRRPRHDHPGDASRRQVALAFLAVFSLSPAAQEKLDLTGASLAGLRAVNAELAGVCLRNADLSNARFNRANLTGADLEGARTDGADFTGAILIGTILASPTPPRR
jgi:hypothetical protein